jgi:hypothetical protein
MKKNISVKVNPSSSLSGLGCFMVLVGIAVLFNFPAILNLIKAIFVK